MPIVLHSRYRRNMQRRNAVYRYGRTRKTTYVYSSTAVEKMQIITGMHVVDGKSAPWFKPLNVAPYPKELDLTPGHPISKLLTTYQKCRITRCSCYVLDFLPEYYEIFTSVSEYKDPLFRLFSDSGTYVENKIDYSKVVINKFWPPGALRVGRFIDRGSSNYESVMDNPPVQDGNVTNEVNAQQIAINKKTKFKISCNTHMVGVDVVNLDFYKSEFKGRAYTRSINNKVQVIGGALNIGQFIDEGAPRRFPPLLNLMPMMNTYIPVAVQQEMMRVLNLHVVVKYYVVFEFSGQKINVNTV